MPELSSKKKLCTLYFYRDIDLEESLLYYNVCYVYLSEIIEPSRRSISLPFLDMMSGLGTCLLALIAFLSNSWFNYTLSLTVLSLISAATILYMPGTDC